MAASKINTSLSSSPSLLKGELGILDSIDDFITNFVGELDDVMATVEELAEDSLKDMMEADAQWNRVAPYARVIVEKGDITYTHEGSDALDQYAFNLEFGVTPNPVLRKAAKTVSEQLEPQVSRLISQAVPSA